jgi:Carbamoyltransferase C-terminus
LLRRFWLNTSLNGPGEPIAETPADALWCLLGLGLDFLMLEDRIVEPAPGFDLLDLVPVIDCDSYTVGHGLTVTLRTPWGPCERPVPPRLARIVAAIDNAATGHEIERRLGDRSLRSELLLLVRRGVVSLRPAGRRWLAGAATRRGF